MSKGIKKIISRSSKVEKIDDLDTEASVLFGLLALIVDIEYRCKFQKSFDYNNRRYYIDEVKSNKVLADQIPSVEERLLGE
ncbi:MAG TPA: hypothetical protein VD947_00305 [Patescibacteria group bacterium]|nr:hypothetical protein [Patescibacteria group bacterium]